MIEPFLKWAGGKRWLVTGYRSLFPKSFKRYVEPFLGGGAVFFYLAPPRALLADSNEELINAYKVVKQYPLQVERTLSRYQNLHCESFYYSMRSRRPRLSVAQAARFMYLNRVCFNGLYRVNLRGIFNVPMGTKTEVAYPSQYLWTISKSLAHATIVASDFEQTLALTGKGDFVYVDPPYTVAHNNNNFLKYNDILFSWQDQIRLSRAVRQASSRGALVLISNADHPSIHELYAGFGFHHIVERLSVLAGRPDARRRITELAIRNYGSAGE